MVDVSVERLSYLLAPNLHPSIDKVTKNRCSQTRLACVSTVTVLERFLTIEGDVSSPLPGPGYVRNLNVDKIHCSEERLAEKPLLTCRFPSGRRECWLSR